MDERWCSIAGFEGLYEISDAGRVRSLVRRRGSWPGRVLKPQRHPRGYVCVTLYAHQSPAKKLIHRLVAAAFVPRAEGCSAVNHLDGVKTNNTAANLEWVTEATNNLHAFRVLRRAPVVLRGDRAPGRKLSADDVREIRARAAHESRHSLATRYSIGLSALGSILRCESWAEIA